MAKYEMRLYKYSSLRSFDNYRGEDFSHYVLQGSTSTEDLTDVMDTFEVTLAGLSFQKEFEPSTKFILEFWQKIDNDWQMVRDMHLIVQNDYVEKPILSDDEYYNHHISFIEASAVAQNRIVDNMSVTYKLKEVSLDTKSVFDLTAKGIYSAPSVEYIPAEDQFLREGEYIHPKNTAISRRYIWDFTGISETSWSNFQYYQGLADASTTRTVSWTIPHLNAFVYKGRTDGQMTWDKLCECSLLVTVYETPTGGGDPREIVSRRIDPTDTYFPSSDYDYFSLPNHPYCIINKWEWEWDINSFWRYWGYAKRLAKHDSDKQDRTLSFTIRNGYKYNINISIYNFTEDEFTEWQLHGVDPNYPAYYTQAHAGTFAVFGARDAVSEYTSSSYPCVSLEFMTYVVGEQDTILTHSAPRANAYDIFVKAQSTTQNFEKQQNIPVTETTMPFYLSQEDVAKLKNTEVIESSFSEKNLWEIFLEIGKYIHAIPKVRFGQSDRFLVTWTYLGQTNQNVDETPTKVSILNHRGIEDYISACSSYVSNMVQVGGIVDEWIAPKSSSDEYLVYNDVSEIITSKKILEILTLDVKCVNDTANLGLPIGEVRMLAGKNPDTGGLPQHGESEMGYVFQKDIYQLLDVVHTSIPNKGLAIYYETGSNKIEGLNYRLPTINSGDIYGDYAIKRILGTVFQIGENSWAKITVNDFIFHIVYRTKDNVRAEQPRPDLRKYMVNATLDKIPQHYQFNNQQDIIVDSVKFGENVYGKLIRSGNSQYTITEWIDDLYSIKQIGQLYNINDELYYIMKVTNTYYAEHVSSKIELSKDYNQLSPIIGIPSEPRFYEISEKNIISRDVSIRDFMVIGRNPIVSDETSTETDTFIKNADFFRKYLVQGFLNLPKYAITVFKNDADRPYGDVEGNEEFYCEVVTPINSYSQRNTLTCKWNMIDNFSAGDRVAENIVIKDYNGSIFTVDNADNAYRTLKPVKYCDAYGRADLVDFYLLNDFNNSQYDISYVIKPYADFGEVSHPVDVYIDVMVINPLIESYLETNCPIPKVGYGLFYTYQMGQGYSWVIYSYNGRGWVLKRTFVTETQTPPDGWLREYNSYIGITDNQIRNLPLSPVRTRLPAYKIFVGTLTAYSNQTISDQDLTNFVTTTKGSLNEGDGLVLIIEDSVADPTIVDAYVCYYSNGLWVRQKISTDSQTIESYKTNHISEYENSIVAANETLSTSGDNLHGIVLLKDNREAIAFNYNISLLTDSDRFVLGSNTWKPYKRNLCIATLNQEVNKFASTTIPTVSIIEKFTAVSFLGPSSEIAISQILENADMTNVKAIAIIEDVQNVESQFADETSFIIARNITGLSEQEALGDWYISFVPNRTNYRWTTFFKNHQ